jgi:hypothetical protein
MWEIKLDHLKGEGYLTTPEGVTVKLPPIRSAVFHGQPFQAPLLHLELNMLQVRFESVPPAKSKYAGKRKAGPVESPSEDMEQPEAEAQLS